MRGPDYKEPAAVWTTPPAPASVKLPPAPPLPKEKGPDAAFVSTPLDVVEKMLDAAQVTKEDVVVDLGSGDGRILIAASRRYGCKSVGYEINPQLVTLSRSKVQDLGLGKLVTIEAMDLFSVDLSGASVVTLYLGAPNNAKLLPQLVRLKPGARIVSHQHLLGDAGPKPDQVLRITSQEDQEEHVIYVWTTPLKMAPADK